MQQSPAFEQWMKLNKTNHHDATLALIHATAWHEAAGDKITVEELFTRAMNHHHQRHTTTLAKAPWAA